MKAYLRFVFLQGVNVCPMFSSRPYAIEGSVTQQLRLFLFHWHHSLPFLIDHFFDRK